MKRPFKIAMFVHSLRSDWNNGNAHFLRGLARALRSMGHTVTAFEPQSSWSFKSLLASENGRGTAAVEHFATTFPDLNIRTYDGSVPFIEEMLCDTDVVIVHEWNEPILVQALITGRTNKHYLLLFHDTHHRAVSTPEQLRQLRIGAFDGILAFGESLRRIYHDNWGVERVWTFHEAADTSTFWPIAEEKATDVVWIGNWGDNERSRELDTFLCRPAQKAYGIRFTVYGVRYPDEGLRALEASGIEYKGYLPNLSVPGVFAKAQVTIHVPRRQYREMLPGIPTIRVFEALACGIPLISAPWDDTEGLFREEDFRRVSTTREMVAAIIELASDEKARKQQAACGLETIMLRHTCLHRAEQLTGICEELMA